jgi:hypothetical protein
MIKFACPSGHPLTAPENLAGKPGKCPKCNAPLVIPRPEDAVTLPASAAGESSGSLPSPVMTPAMGSGTNLRGGAEVFVFLCPNGHKLNGPPSMKGKPGQCPHCGARFIIPTDEDIEESQQGQTYEESAEEGAAEGSAEHSAERGGINFDRFLNGSQEETGSQTAFDRPPVGAAGLGYIVGRLWERRTEGSELEVFLAEGEIVAPDFYSESLSTSDYGVFAVQEGDGTFAITAIPWSAVRRVGMRRLTELADDLFQ